MNSDGATTLNTVVTDETYSITYAEGGVVGRSVLVVMRNITQDEMSMIYNYCLNGGDCIWKPKIKNKRAMVLTDVVQGRKIKINLN